MSDQDNGQVTTLQRPTSNDPEAWKIYWKAKGWPWRTEPEIDAERQKYLAERRAIVPNIEKGIYSFKDIKLSRADVEWLLITHENGRGPVDLRDMNQRDREGLDLRGADLNNVNLSRLPLTHLKGGLTEKEWQTAEWRYGVKNKPTQSSLRMEKVDLSNAKLEGANLNRAQLTGVKFIETELYMTEFRGANLSEAELERIDLRGAVLRGANLYRAHLKEVDLSRAALDVANLNQAQLEKVNLFLTKLTGVNLSEAKLNGTNLKYAILNDGRGFGPQLVDIQWGDTNLALIDWSKVSKLADERKARQKRKSNDFIKGKATRLNEYQIAVRANRQLAMILQGHGLNDDAVRFAYRAQLCQRIVLRYQKKFGQYLFSGFLDALAGYGYRPGRAVLWYLATILVFGFAYHFLGGLTLYPPDAFVFSVMSFHGRGFFPALSQETNLHNPLVMLAALEAIIGLLIEISFIATFTQRFFGR